MFNKKKIVGILSVTTLAVVGTVIFGLNVKSNASEVVSNVTSYGEDTSTEEDVMYEKYKSIEQEQLDEYRTMSDVEIENKEIEILGKYGVGEEFSLEDTNFMLFKQYEYDLKNVTRDVPYAGNNEQAIMYSGEKYDIEYVATGGIISNKVREGIRGKINVALTLNREVKQSNVTTKSVLYGMNMDTSTMIKLDEKKITSTNYNKSFRYDGDWTYNLNDYTSSDIQGLKENITCSIIILSETDDKISMNTAARFRHKK